MSNLKEKLGARIKQLRKQQSLSQEKLAELINLDIPNLSNIERGKRFMSSTTLENITKALNVTERELFDFREFEPQKYFRVDIEELLDQFEENDLEFFLEVMKCYLKSKSR